jgi:hypothetical protein
MQQRIVSIKTVSLGKRVDKSIISGVSRTIGSSFDSKTKSIKIGISEEEQRVLLPPIIGTNPESTNWETKRNDWFANLKIQVDPIDGLELNIATTKRKVELNGQTIEVDYPVAPIDYIKYKQALATTNLVADSPEKALGESKLYYIEDKHLASEKQFKVNQYQDGIEAAYLRLTQFNTTTNKFVKEDDINAVLRAYGYNPLIMTDFDKKAKIIEFKEQDKITAKSEYSMTNCKFYNTVNDPDLAIIGLIYSCLTNGVMKRLGDYVVDGFDESKILGKTIKECVVFMKDQANSVAVMRYKDLNTKRNEAPLT